jgi:hypothetical protein
LEDVVVNLETGNSHVQLLTRAGVIRHKLKLTDRAGDVNHYAYRDAAGKTQALLSVNLKTREYFYNETGVRAGHPYTVKAHGWLTHSPRASQPRTTLGNKARKGS